MGYPSVYPTGVTLYDRDRAWGGFTLLPTSKGALLVDMSGREVNLWAGLAGFPNKMAPGGYVFGSTGARRGDAAYQDQLDLVEVDWDGNVVWKWDHTELVRDEGHEPRWMARQHHDFEREGSPVGYYAPELEPKALEGSTLILAHENTSRPEISDVPLIDDKFVEVTWDGRVTWEWRCADHFDELGFSEDARRALRTNPSVRGSAGGDWMHVNSISTLGPNRHYDEGDDRFAPDNIIFDARNANILAIVSKKTGRIVWRLGPDFEGPNASEGARKLGCIIGQHHLHMIPRGLPGAGDLLVFDNGGAAGYDAPNAMSPSGVNAVRRDYSRVIQFDPVTFEITWEYTPVEAGFMPFADGSKLYSPYISSAQRLPNGNTLVTEGSDGRVFEVTPSHQVVWEFINPYFRDMAPGFPTNMVYRAYRIPYEWVPQAERRPEVGIDPVDISAWRVPGASDERLRVTPVEGIDSQEAGITGVGDGHPGHADLCMLRVNIDELEAQRKRGACYDVG